MKNLRSLKFNEPFFDRSFERRFLAAIKWSQMSLETFFLEDQKSSYYTIEHPSEVFAKGMAPLKEFGWDVRQGIGANRISAFSLTPSLRHSFAT